ncbi:Gfo/Idh/MocA family protein [Microbacterium sp. G2-8]|uniref:Gfo/Idh/MocA family protein n=1 Tax=Microbacterium sp. G2-8 TaxID=2842454 RepID=UPI001C898089|nr:Gfo/Idh/MocA family oxidoreductase [Microbacterium sp. G2-8]
MNAPRVGLIGTGGHGGSHLARLQRRHAAGTVRLVAVADPHPPAPEDLPDGVRRHTDGADLIAAGGIDVVVICTPIHTHFRLAAAAVATGCDVLLEKPTTATMAEFVELEARAARAGARVQVGFQSLGSSAIPSIRERVARGEIGQVVRYSATGAWVRDSRYWQRSRWAGKRTLDGQVVADGVLTNPLAHASATALAIAGATARADVEHLDLDLWRANDIEADDTSVAVFSLPGEVRLTTAVTLAAQRHHDPFVEVVGTAGSLRFWYKTDVVERREGGIVREAAHAVTVDLLDNLLAARRGEAELLASLPQTGAFMTLVDGVMSAPDPSPVPARCTVERDDEFGRHVVVRGIEDDLARALEQERTFRQLGSDFTRIA